METAIYLRTSTEEQHPENQLKDCLTLIKNKEDYKVYQEQQSAWRDKDRPIFEDIKKKIAAKKIKGVIVWDLDRLYRNRKKLIDFFQFCKIYNCKVNSFRQQWLNKFNDIPEPFNEIMFDMMLQIMGWLAEEESKKKSERVKIAYQNHKGKKWGRKGLSKNTINEVLKLHAEGHSLREISNMVFYYDKNRNKKKISLGAVHKIISQNPH